MTDANKNLVLRILSAAVLLPAVVALLWLGPLSTSLLLAAVAGFLAFEFYAITLKKLDAAQVLGIAAATALPLAAGLAPERISKLMADVVGAAGLPLSAGQLPVFSDLVVAGAGGLVLLLFCYYLLAGPLADAPVRVSLVFTGVVYGGLLLAALAALRRLPEGLEWVFLAMLVTWANDTGAYISGRSLGRRKLYPAVSPGKTWEGFGGGLLFTVGAAFVARATFFPGLSAPDCLWVAVPASILGPAGDLSESMIKRAYGVKDSGRIMPGHGGLLDRVDALLFNGPYLFLYAWLTRGP